ncbi:uncharacterized protein FOMMEDRAFT_110095 [Fomitiporia mediterranea MF3/22]|uniref:uncharacterized protein n=1 Tax=Fomitiporia mediterranea (strain MF3/22) TaxID=694068 RepID=UPI0004409B05|nr:uncharacterized protein FOMMEDRAFT_110095 [Fomitiporia mediterranea MF3/22]EJD00777.1 hypothetical protein FOMMEDRAFT_110095 [Fomitiporia mediterranea MF3/22]
MALLGVYSLTVLRGSISLMGAEVYAYPSRSHIIYAPRCSPVPVIRAIASGDLNTPNLPYEINRKVDQKSILILLEDVSTGIGNIGRVCKTFESAFELSSFGESVLNLASAKLLSSIPRSLQPFQVPDSWKAAFSSLPICFSEEHDEDVQSLDPVTVLVRGRKRTGKSTLARTLGNRLLNRYRRVAFLECDVGQTEFTPPGLVSLHVIDGPVFGPPFTHPALPYASHYIGATTPRNNPEHYLSAVSALVETYKLEVQYPAPEDELYETDEDDRKNADVIPLVVNTMGWTKGLGTDLARRVEELVAPTHMVFVGSLTSNMNELSMRSTISTGSEYDRSGSGPRTFEVEAISLDAQSARYSAADWRTLSLMSYFHSIPSPSQFDLLPVPVRNRTSASHDSCALPCTWDFRLPLIAQVPYAVSVGEAIDNVFLVGAGMEDVVPLEISRVLNGAIVALVSCQPDVQDDHTHDARESRLPYTQGAPPSDPSRSNCIGLALIRGVSPSLFDSTSQPENESSSSMNDVLHILTPVPPTLIAAAEARCLVKGEVELPVWGMLDYRELERDGSLSRGMDGIPYLQWSKSDAIGAERRRVRRNIMRRGQM